MNIFILEEHIAENVQSYCDKHVVKMVLETAQILCASHSRQDTPYKKTHLNHPCVKWVKESLANYIWLVRLGIELCKEYTYRYEKFHKSQQVIEWCLANFPELPNIEQTQFYLCVPEEFKLVDNNCISNVIEIYRLYYQYKKDNGMQMKYTKREVPKWLC